MQERVNIDALNMHVQTLAEKFANYGSELESLESVNEDFFGSSGAVYTPKVGKTLFDIWNDNIEDELGGFIDAYTEWMAMATEEKTLREDFQANQLNFYDAAKDADAKFREAAMNGETFNVEEETPFDNIGGGTITTSTLSGYTSDEIKARQRLTSEQMNKVNHLFEYGGDTSDLTEDEMNYYKSLGVDYVKEIFMAAQAEKRGEDAATSVIRGGIETFANQLTDIADNIDESTIEELRGKSRDEIQEFLADRRNTNELQ